MTAVAQPTLFGDTLAEARDTLQLQLDEGTTCPCCDQFAKVYSRKINAGHARALIALYRAVGRDWGHLATYDQSREASKLAYWGLIEEESARRDDGGRSGWWRITDLGERFLRNQLLVPKHARVYDGRLLRLDDTDGLVSIVDALGTRFNYSELMAGI